MYGLWILATAFALLTAGAVVLTTRFNKKQKEGLLTDSKTIKGFAWQTATAGALAAVFGLSFVITGLFAVVKPIQADKQYREFEAKRAVVSQLVASGIESEYAIAQSMVSANDWYAQAKADKEKFGIFSMYYKLDFDWIMPVSKDNLEPIEKGTVYVVTCHSFRIEGTYDVVLVSSSLVGVCKTMEKATELKNDAIAHIIPPPSATFKEVVIDKMEIK